VRLAVVAAAAAITGGCGGPRGDDCGGDLEGVWRIDAGGRWHAIAGPHGWEWYPMFDDRPRGLPGGVVGAPGMIELDVRGRGAFVRRYQRGAAICEIRTPARLRGCALEVRPPPPPVDWGTCAAGDAAVQRWTVSAEARR
jgi:hypothetical protein